MTTRRLAAALLCTAVMAVTAGCSTPATVPADFCKVPVSKTALAPLIPHDGPVRQTYYATEGQPGAGCALSAGGHRVLFVAFATWDHDPDPGAWKGSAAPYKYAAERPVSFPGRAAIGSNGASVRALCTSPDTYMTFGIYFFGDRVENTPNGYKKLRPFIDDFVPKETKKFGCTR
ncbi:hypothetical protein [Streptomyces malaysiense]|uniref:DUF3558 domain-containing protein n=1 Tax=Streptomyces malaysiense TaxID=1428626 RepID=A0A1J4PYQ9_9ACTN|nr:hypothetical protein [Streptomyces malaysiense]OIK25889.1 hypothetical protein VT52_019420 [Streptomyces malaysiense]